MSPLLPLSISCSIRLEFAFPFSYVASKVGVDASVNFELPVAVRLKKAFGGNEKDLLLKTYSEAR